MRTLCLLLSLVICSGCVTTARASHASYDWSGETFPENPVSIGPYFLGLGLGALAGAPLLLISWPATVVAFPEDGDGEDRIWSQLAPVGFLGAGVGTILAAPFYPFGLPFMDAEADADEWDEEGSWEDDEENFEAGPPGGDEDPLPAPWLKDSTKVPTQDGLPLPPFRQTLILPWEDYKPDR